LRLLCPEELYLAAVASKCTPELQVYLFAERILEHQLEDNERVADQKLFARWGVEENSRRYLAEAAHRATPRPQAIRVGFWSTQQEFKTNTNTIPYL
jgi:hypothetical protein